MLVVTHGEALSSRARNRSPLEAILLPFGIHLAMKSAQEYVSKPAFAVISAGLTERAGA